MKRILIITFLLSTFAGASAFDKVKAYAISEGLTLQQIRDMSIQDLIVEIGLTKQDLRGKAKAKRRIKTWKQRQDRAAKVLTWQGLVRNLPQSGDAVVIDIDPDQNIVMVYIDGGIQE